MYQSTFLGFLNMGGSETILIMVVALLMFGGKKLPELARGLGKGLREFKDASEGVKREIHRNINAMDIDDELAKDNNDAYHPTEDSSTAGTLESDYAPSMDDETDLYASINETTSLEEDLTLEDHSLTEITKPTSTVIDENFVNENHKV